MAASIFLGYCVRRTQVPDGWVVFATEHVAEICSVSDCIAARPQGWVERWDFNRACCYATEAAALAAAAGAGGFRALAYALIGVRLDANGGLVALDPDAMLPRDLPALPPGPVAEGFAPLGYDVVAEPGPSSLGFGCSPLSCNGLAREVAVNRHCLLDDLDTALRLAERWGREQPEPGRYVVVQVLGRR